MASPSPDAGPPPGAPSGRPRAGRRARGRLLRRCRHVPGRPRPTAGPSGSPARRRRPPATAACPASYAAPDPSRPRIALTFDLAEDLATVRGTEKVTFTPDLPVTRAGLPADREHRAVGRRGQPASRSPRPRRPRPAARSGSSRPARPAAPRAACWWSRWAARCRPGSRSARRSASPSRSAGRRSTGSAGSGRTRGGAAGSRCSPGSAASAGTGSRCCSSPRRARPARPPRWT